jgi:hypothetical protein
MLIPADSMKIKMGANHESANSRGQAAWLTADKREPSNVLKSIAGMKLSAAAGFRSER